MKKPDPLGPFISLPLPTHHAETASMRMRTTGSLTPVPSLQAQKSVSYMVKTEGGSSWGVDDSFPAKLPLPSRPPVSRLLLFSAHGLLDAFPEILVKRLLRDRSELLGCSRGTQREVRCGREPDQRTGESCFHCRGELNKLRVKRHAKSITLALPRAS